MDTLALNGLIWIILFPFVIIGIIFGFLVMCHYHPVQRTLDAWLISLLTALFGDCAILVLIQACLFYGIKNTWEEELCHFYVWAWPTLQFAQLFTIVGLSIDRILLIKQKKKYAYYTSSQTRATLFVLWLAAVFIGIVPVTGWRDIEYFHSSSQDCTYLPYEVHRGFAVFVTVVEVCSMLVCLVCLVDVWCHLKYLTNKSFLTVKPNQALSSHTGLAQNSVVSGQSKVSRSLDVAAAYDNCCVGCLIVFVVVLFNHLPYTIICVVGVVTGQESLTPRIVMVWLLLVQSLLAPHVLWLFNTRYRLALIHVFDCLRGNGGFFTSETHCRGVVLETYNTNVGQGDRGHVKRQRPEEEEYYNPPNYTNYNTAHSFQYEAFSPRPIKTTSEPNLAIVSNGPHKYNGILERSRSVEEDLDLDTDNHQRSPGPSIGERNLQMDDIVAVVHSHRTVNNTFNDRYPLQQDHVYSSESFNNEQHNDGTDGYMSHTHSTRSSASSTQSPRAKRRKCDGGSTAGVAESAFEGVGDDAPRGDQVEDTHSSAAEYTSPQRGSESDSETLVYNDDDMESVLDLPPLYPPHPPLKRSPANYNLHKSWKELHQFDNNIEEIIAPSVSIQVENTDDVDEFSTSEFDETSGEDSSFTQDANVSSKLDGAEDVEVAMETPIEGEMLPAEKQATSTSTSYMTSHRIIPPKEEAEETGDTQSEGVHNTLISESKREQRNDDITIRPYSNITHASAHRKISPVNANEVQSSAITLNGENNDTGDFTTANPLYETLSVKKPVQQEKLDVVTDKGNETLESTQTNDNAPSSVLKHDIIIPRKADAVSERPTATVTAVPYSAYTGKTYRKVRHTETDGKYGKAIAPESVQIKKHIRQRDNYISSAQNEQLSSSNSYQPTNTQNSSHPHSHLYSDRDLDVVNSNCTTDSKKPTDDIPATAVSHVPYERHRNVGKVIYSSLYSDSNGNTGANVHTKTLPVENKENGVKGENSIERENIDYDDYINSRGRGKVLGHYGAIG